MDPAPFQTDALGGFGVLAIALERFAEGAHVHVNDGGLKIIAGDRFGHRRLLEGEHAADRAAEIGAGLQVSGAHTLDPGGFFHRLLVGWAQQAAAVRPGAAEHAFERQAGDHVGHDTVSHGVFADRRVKAGGAGGQDDSPHRLFAVAGFSKSLIHGRDLGNQGVGLEGLDQVVHRPYFHGLHGGFYGGVGGHHQHLKIRLDDLGFFQYRHAVHTRHLDVQKHEMKRGCRDFFQGFGARCRHCDAVALLIPQPGIQRLSNDGLVVHHQDMKGLAAHGRQVNGSGGADGFTGPAAGAGHRVDGVGVGDVVGYRQIDRLALGETGVEGVGDRHRTDLAASVAANASFGIDGAGKLVQGYLKFARFARHRCQGRAQQDIDIFVKKSFAQAGLGAGIPVHHGQHPAHTAVVGWKLVVQLAQDTTHVRRLVGQGHPVSHLGQVDGRPNTADPGADYEGAADFPIHMFLPFILLETTNQSMIADKLISW